MGTKYRRLDVSDLNVSEISPGSWLKLRDHGRRFPPNYLHDSRAGYLYWDSAP